LEGEHDPVMTVYNEWLHGTSLEGSSILFGYIGKPGRLQRGVRVRWKTTPRSRRWGQNAKGRRRPWTEGCDVYRGAEGPFNGFFSRRRNQRSSSSPLPV